MFIVGQAYSQPESLICAATARHLKTFAAPSYQSLAIPVTPFKSNFCIVAGGWHGYPDGGVKVVLEVITQRRMVTPDSKLSAVSSRLLASSSSKHGVQDLDVHVAGEEAVAPGVFEVGERLGGDGFLRGFSRGLQLANALACRDQHVAEFLN